MRCILVYEESVRDYRFSTVLLKVEDIFRLLSYTKYRSMGFPMKTVVKQFSGNENDRQLIIQRMEKQREEAWKKAAYYHELADSIDGHLTVCKKTRKKHLRL
ncbi:hypothetical protein FACS189483_09490 [Spirochaetia bacterium]|nr:hypothetical protein FACS189483_09490 [Spirochaetia bacterium]